MTDADLVTLMDREATLLETENCHCAAVLMRAAAARIRASMAAKPKFFAGGEQAAGGPGAVSLVGGAG